MAFDEPLLPSATLTAAMESVGVASSSVIVTVCCCVVFSVAPSPPLTAVTSMITVSSVSSSVSLVRR